MANRKAKAKTKKTYHIFRRRRKDTLPGEDTVSEHKCLVKRPPSWDPVILPVTEQDIIEALERDGQADGQNCGGAVCVRKHANLFSHRVSGALVDWWRHRVYIYEGKPKRGAIPVCYEYAHYDKLEELFDTDAGLRKLLARIRRSSERVIYVTLYPIRRGYNPRTGVRISSGNPEGGAGSHRSIGADLRFENYVSGRAG